MLFDPRVKTFLANLYMIYIVSDLATCQQVDIKRVVFEKTLIGITCCGTKAKSFKALKAVSHSFGNTKTITCCSYH